MRVNVSSEPNSDDPDRAKIGPGTVILIVGPSGAGKDALLKGVASRLHGDERFIFPTRIISRPHHTAEEHQSATPQDMIEAERRGAYALAWRAHGLTYGISSEIDDAIRAGASVIFNASRTVVSSARERFEHVAILYIDASQHLRAQRLAARGRETDAEIETRLHRTVSSWASFQADAIIENEGELEDGITMLLNAVRLAANRK